MNDSTVTYALLDKVAKIIDSGGEPPDYGGMEKRVEKLESDLAALKTDVAVIRSNYATTTDIAKLGVSMQSEINAQTWKLIVWVCSFGTALVAATYFIATHAK
jgi:hypothetical protein